MEHNQQKKKSKKNITRDIEVKNNLTIARGEGGKDNGEKGFQELLYRTHGQNQGGGWKIYIIFIYIYIIYNLYHPCRAREFPWLQILITVDIVNQ